MCAMSVQDILARKSNGESEMNPMYQLWKPGLSLKKDANPTVCILFVSWIELMYLFVIFKC